MITLSATSSLYPKTTLYSNLECGFKCNNGRYLSFQFIVTYYCVSEDDLKDIHLAFSNRDNETLTFYSLKYT